MAAAAGGSLERSGSARSRRPVLSPLSWCAWMVEFREGNVILARLYRYCGQEEDVLLRIDWTL